MDTVVERPGRGRILALAVVLACTALASCDLARNRPPESPRPRVLLVGIDGASPRVLDTMFAAGRLKNLRSIADRGSYGPLQSEEILLSPRVWTTMATGKVPDKHGILGWVKVGTDVKADLFYGSDRRGLALWNILSDAGKSVAVVNWLVTYPPEIVNGVIVSDHALATEVEGKKYVGGIFAKSVGMDLNTVQSAENGVSAVYPEDWAPRALAPAHKEVVLTDVQNPFLETSPDFLFHDHRRNFRDFWEVDQRLASMTLEILKEKQPDVTMVLFQGIDRVSHSLFGCLESTAKYPENFHPTFEQRLNCQRALYDYYEFTDQLIGRLLESFDDDDLVMIVSDHGFEAVFNAYGTGGHDSADAKYGVCLAKGPRIRRDGTVLGTTVLDIAPTVLEWYGLPAAKDMDGKPAAFLEPPATPLERIATYDTKPVERLGNGQSGGETRVKDQLRSLGYLQ